MQASQLLMVRVHISFLLILLIPFVSCTQSPGFRASLKRIQSNENHTQRRLTLSTGARLQWQTYLNVPGEILYNVEFTIGTPGQAATAILDSGSNLVWLQCDYSVPYKNLAKQSLPYYNPSKSSTFKPLKCPSASCEGPYFRGCNKDKTCRYFSGYASSLSSLGLLAKETFNFGSVSVPSIRFGCGTNNSVSDGESTAILGIGRGPFSLPTQLGISNFSLCLAPESDSGPAGHFLLGSSATLNPRSGVVQSIPTVKNDDSHFFVSLIGITYDNKNIPIPKSELKMTEHGKGVPLCIDNGMPNTIIPFESYKVLREEIINAMQQNPLPRTFRYEPCFLVYDINDLPSLPDLVFHFAGGANMTFSRDYYMTKFLLYDPYDYRYSVHPERKKICSTIVGAEKLSIPFILGDYQLQDLHVLFDMKNNMVSFVHEKCSNL